jgi:hypothetical protein
VAVRVVTVTMSLVVGLSFVFAFGNVLNLALQVGVPIFIAPLVAPAGRCRRCLFVSCSR